MTQERCLSGAVCADDRNSVAVLQFQVHVIEGADQHHAAIAIIGHAAWAKIADLTIALWNYRSANRHKRPST